MCQFRFVPRSRSPSSRRAYEHGQRAVPCPQDTVPIDQRTAPHDLTSRSPNLSRPRSVADPRRGCRCGPSRHDAARQIRESRSAVDVPGTVRRSTAARSRRRLSRTPAPAARRSILCWRASTAVTAPPENHVGSLRSPASFRRALDVGTCQQSERGAAWHGLVEPTGGAALDRRRWAVFARSTSINAQPSMIDKGIATATSVCPSWLTEGWGAAS
jgi:hypothetical protein